MDRTYLRGDLYYANLGRGIGSEQEGYRPVVIIQNNVGNRHSPTVIIAAISSKVGIKQAADPLLCQCGGRTGASVDHPVGAAPHRG